MALATCSPNDLSCSYGDNTCVCILCPGPCRVTPRFTCYGPPTTPGCPKAAPNTGTSCTGAQQCTYGVCGANITERDCVGGFWVDVPVPCPL